MNCQQFQTHLPTFVDGELGVEQTLAASAHVAECSSCRILAGRERAFRQLLRRQPQETTPPEFRASILAACRREVRRGRVLRWSAASALAAAAVLVAILVPPALRTSEPLVAELVDKHIAYSQIERPAELASTDRREVERWFLEQATLRVTVPDYSPAGIRLVGGRIANVEEWKVAYVLYEKGHTLLSIFMLPTRDGMATLEGTRITYRGQDYFMQKRKGHRTIAWSDGQAVFGLVSMLDSQALLECADRLRVERAGETRL